jgi:hypothetical protein
MLDPLIVAMRWAARLGLAYLAAKAVTGRRNSR